MRIGIIQFPGSNCERETSLAVKRAGMEPVDCLWNTPKEIVEQFDGYIIVGGFSYEDRSRAGIIAALDPMMDTIQKQSHLGKPVLGICNGAQILVEKGLVPGLANNKLGAALTDNIRVQNGKILGHGYYNAWVNIRLSDDHQHNAFTRYLTPKNILPIPVAHGEGRFVIPKELLKEMQENGQNLFQYCDANGNLSSEFPVNPNGSVNALAAISNKAGNVLAIMPHPERTSECDALLFSMRDYIAEGLKESLPHDHSSPDSYGLTELSPRGLTAGPMHYHPDELSIKPYSSFNHSANKFEMIIDTMLVDNQSVSVENALQRKGISVKIQRYVHWELNCDSSTLDKIMTAGILFNDRKEVILSREDIFSQGRNFATQLPCLDHGNHMSQNYYFLVRQKDDIHGKHTLQMLQRHFNVSELENLSKSILWKISPKNVPVSHFIQQIIHSNILFNPYAYDCYTY